MCVGSSWQFYINRCLRNEVSGIRHVGFHDWSHWRWITSKCQFPSLHWYTQTHLVELSMQFYGEMGRNSCPSTKWSLLYVMCVTGFGFMGLRFEDLVVLIAKYWAMRLIGILWTVRMGLIAWSSGNYLAELISVFVTNWLESIYPGHNTASIFWVCTILYLVGDIIQLNCYL